MRSVAPPGPRGRRPARPTPKLTLLVALLALVATACGPRFDRSELTVEAAAGGVAAPSGGGAQSGGTATTGGATTPGGTVGGDTGVVTDTATDSASSDGTGTATPGGSTAPSSGGGTTGGSGESPGGGTDPGSGTTTPGGSTQPVAPGPAPGVTEDAIKIAYLVPLTGAAPLPTAWDEGARLYWQWKGANGGTHGRTVEVLIYDTESSTSTAVQRARQAVNDDQVFTILTLDRLEVQEAVARFLEQVGMPHVMVQSPANPPADWQHTFTISVDHVVQGRGIADFFGADLGADNNGRPVAVVREQTPALAPGTEAFEAQAEARGVNVVRSLTIDPSNPDVSTTVLSLQQSGAEVVWLYMAPTVAARIISQAGGQGYRPIWFANSISWQFELMHDVTGGFMEGAYAFSPWVSLSHPAADEYKAAYREYLDGEPDDFGLVGWGVGGVLDAALEAVGPGLGWDSFRNQMRGLVVDTDVWAPVDFSGGGSIGSSSVAVYLAENGAWKTVDAGRGL